MQNLETRPLYSIGTVSRLSGIKADTLRVWERRYGLGASGKSPGGRREYTQSDLEHLQIVAALRDQGTRIGDIAKRDRKTLEMMFHRANKNGAGVLPAPKPRVLFAGESLAHWLDGHPGCIANVSAYIARQSVDAVLDIALEGIGHFDALVLEFPEITEQTFDKINALQSITQATQICVCHGEGGTSLPGDTGRDNIELMAMPPQSADLGAKINHYVTEFHRRSGDTNAGDLANAKPKQFSDSDLSLAQARAVNGSVATTQQLSKLIQALSQFEDLAAQGDVQNWQDAAVQSCVFAYTNQARWLMEKAMGAVLDQPSEE
ncbi:MAG: MerR family transcriptional regulator [Halioglobus sp.]